jgi:hypothetical protein
MSTWMNTEHLDDERIVEIADIAMKSELILYLILEKHILTTEYLY